MESAKTRTERIRFLRRCRQLARRISPARPPEGGAGSEYAWQCRALNERVQLYDELLNDNPDQLAPNHLEYRLQRTEMALSTSLEYFRRVHLGQDIEDAEDESVPIRSTAVRPSQAQGLQ